MGQQVGRVGEPGAGLQHQPPPPQQQQPRGPRGSNAARPAGRRREAAGRTAEGGFNIFTQHGEGWAGGRAAAGRGRGGRGRGGREVTPGEGRVWDSGKRGTVNLPPLPPSFVVVGLTGGGEGCGSRWARRAGQSPPLLPRPRGCWPRPSLEPGGELGAGDTSLGAADRESPPATAGGRWHRRESKLRALGSCHCSGS